METRNLWYLRRSNTISSSSVTPRKPDLPLKSQSSSFPMANGDKPSSSSFPHVELQLLSIPSVPYTSLKDLLPSTAAGFQSPTGAAAVASASQSAYEISIRNRLVKQAAWAYLQPVTASPDSSGRFLFRRMWVRFPGEFRSPVNSFVAFITQHVIPAITGLFKRLLGALRIGRNGRR